MQAHHEKSDLSDVLRLPFQPWNAHLTSPYELRNLSHCNDIFGCTVLVLHMLSFDGPTGSQPSAK